MISQKRLDKALSKALLKARDQERISLEGHYRYVIFSDHHKGARNEADDFRQCESTYLAALDYYLANDYTLIVLGDVEELWEERARSVLDSYTKVFEREALFHQKGRYIRIVGNHDNAWQLESQVKKYLHRFFSDIQVKAGLVFDFAGDEETTGEILLVHGNQGTIFSDSLSFISRLLLPLYREFQIWTGLGRTTPAEDACLRSEHDTKMYLWAAKQGKLILIAGHTHRPVWSSRTHLEKLLWQLYELQQLEPKDRPPDFKEQVRQLKEEIREREEKYPPCTDTIKTQPCYFNTGCCRFEDGDITGIEIQDGQIRLIKWGGENENITRTILEQTHLSGVFFFL